MEVTKKNKVRGNWVLLIVAMIVAVSLLGGMLVYLEGGKTAQAQNIVTYQTTTLEDGTDCYTETTYSDALLVGHSGLVQIHAVATVSGSTSFTITAQFSNEPVGCASVDATTGWFDAKEYVAYVAQTVIISTTSMTVSVGVESIGGTTTTVTTTVTGGAISSTTTSDAMTEGSVTLQLVLATDTVGGREVLALGRCFRVMMEAADNFTPTVHVRQVGRQ